MNVLKYILYIQYGCVEKVSGILQHQLGCYLLQYYPVLPFLRLLSVVWTLWNYRLSKKAVMGSGKTIHMRPT